MVFEEAEKTKEATNQVIYKLNDDQPKIDGMFQDLQEVLTWKKRIRKRKTGGES